MLCSFLFSRLRWRERIFSLFAFIRLFFFHSNISQKKGPSHNCSYYYMVLFFWLLLYIVIYSFIAACMLSTPAENRHRPQIAPCTMQAYVCLCIVYMYVALEQWRAVAVCLTADGAYLSVVSERPTHI